jgi:hypothetical protein
MRLRLARWGFALTLGAASMIPTPAAAQADDPAGYATAGASVSADTAPVQAAPAATPKKKRKRRAAKPEGPYMCAKCMARAYPTTTVFDANGRRYSAAGAGDCVACQTGSSAAPMMLSPTIEAPGYAAIGGTAAGLSYAMAGSLEPAPVGVMTASYRPAAGAAGGAPGYAVVGGGGAQPMPPPAPLAMPRSSGNRPHILAHLFGLDIFSHMIHDREDRVLSRHAAIAYGSNNATVSDLPASVVYRQR